MTELMVLIVFIGSIVAIGAFVKWFQWVKDNIVVLQLIVFALGAWVGGTLGLYKYWHEKNESRRITAREMALQHLVVDGFLVAAAEIEAAGHQVNFTWMSVSRLYDTQDRKANLLALRDGLLRSEHCRQMLYGDNARLAEAAARIQMIHGAPYYAIMSVYAELCKWMSVLTLDPPDAVFRSSPQAAINVVGNYFMFANGIATKAAEILMEDERLTFSPRHVRSNTRFAALVAVCEEFRRRHKAYADAPSNDQKAIDEKLQELNDWMTQVIDRGGVASI